MTKVLLIRTLHGLRPANDIASENISKIKIGETIQCEITKPRSLPWHKRYWALIGLIANNSDYTPDNIHALLKLKCGCSKLIKDRHGKEYWIPDSIAFSKMDGIKWSEYWNKVVDYVCTDLMPVSKQDLALELALLVGLSPIVEMAIISDGENYEERQN